MNNIVNLIQQLNGFGWDLDDRPELASLRREMFKDVKVLDFTIRYLLDNSNLRLFNEILMYFTETLRKHYEDGTPIIDIIRYMHSKINKYPDVGEVVYAAIKKNDIKTIVEIESMFASKMRNPTFFGTGLVEENRLDIVKLYVEKYKWVDIMIEDNFYLTVCKDAQMMLYLISKGCRFTQDERRFTPPEQLVRYDSTLKAYNKRFKHQDTMTIV